jgi:hypothetical protein
MFFGIDKVLSRLHSWFSSNPSVPILPLCTGGVQLLNEGCCSQGRQEPKPGERPGDRRDIESCLQAIQGAGQISLRRGFKASANRIAVRLRRGQNCAPHEPIDLDVIAERLEIKIVPLSALTKEAPQAVRHLSITDSDAFSATTIRWIPASASSFTTIRIIRAGNVAICPTKSRMSCWAILLLPDR